MEEKIRERLAKWEKAKQDATMQLTVIENIIVELRDLLAPEPIVTGAQLGAEQES